MPSTVVSRRAPRCERTGVFSCSSVVCLFGCSKGHWEVRPTAVMTPGGGVALESRQRITGGATGAVALLPRASGGAVDVAYPSGDVVVVSEVSATGALSDAPVVIRPGSAEDGATSPPGAGRIICAWAPGAERAGLLAIGALGAVHLYAPSDAGVAWTLVDRIALDADATALTWTDDGLSLIHI